MRGAANLLGNYVACWLVSFDPKVSTLFNGFGLVVTKFFERDL